jgi:hypothetical protein
MRFVMPVCSSVRPQGTTWLPKDGFSWDLLQTIFRKTVKTNIHFWSHLCQFFLEREMFRTKVVEKIKTRILCSITFRIFVILYFSVLRRFVRTATERSDQVGNIPTSYLAGWGVSDSNLFSENYYYDWDISGVPQSLGVSARYVPQIGRERLLSSAFHVLFSSNSKVRRSVVWETDVMFKFSLK